MSEVPPASLCDVKYLKPSYEAGWLKLLYDARLSPAQLAHLEDLRLSLERSEWYGREYHAFQDAAPRAAGQKQGACVTLWRAKTSPKRAMMTLIDSAKVQRLTLDVAQKHRQQPFPLPQIGFAGDSLLRYEALKTFSINDFPTPGVNQLSQERVPRPGDGDWASAYEHLRTLWISGAEASQDFSPRDVPVFIAIDTETWEVVAGRGRSAAELIDSTLELGWSIVEPLPLAAAPTPPRPWNELGGRSAPLEGAPSLPPIGSWQQTTTHYLVEANYKMGRKNGRYVPDHRDGFLFGDADETATTSSWIGRPGPFSNGTRFASFQEIGQELSRTITRLHAERENVFIVFHDANGDMPTLRALGIDTSTWQREASSVLAPSQGPSIRVLDTIKLFAALRGVSQMTNLKTCSLVLDVNGGVVENTHNAANDAYFTAAVLATMLAGPPLEEMRTFVEARWEVAHAVSKGSSFKSRIRRR